MLSVIGLTISTQNRGAAQEIDPGFEARRSQGVPEASFQELLEYLGQWETDEGSWIDPSDLDWLLQPDQETGNDEEK